MERYKLSLMVIFVLSAVLSAGAKVQKYNDAKIAKEFLKGLPVEERNSVLRYVLNHGYELVEGKQNDVYNSISPRTYKAIYRYYANNFLKSDVCQLKALGGPFDMVCFPSGCIELDDPGIHPK